MIDNRFISECGNMVLTTEGVIDMMMLAKDMHGVLIENTPELIKGLPVLEGAIVYDPDTDDVKEIKWAMFDMTETEIIDEIIDRCKNGKHADLMNDDAYMNRIEQELVEVVNEQQEGFILSVAMICDTLDQNGILRGFGRGSSCASLLLFMLGVHDVDPVMYDIPMSEFFKKE